MSSAVYVASLAITGLPTFYWMSAKTPGGAVPDHFVIDEETLKDDGVDFERWRVRRWFFAPFAVNVMEDDISFANGIARFTAYLQAVRKFGTLTYTAGGVRKIFRRVKVMGIGQHPENPTGQILNGCGTYGPGASSPSLATLLSQWTLQLTEIST